MVINTPLCLLNAMDKKLAPIVRENSLVKNEIIGSNKEQDCEHLTIDMILCRTKKWAVVEYALRESNKPIGVAAYRIVRRLPAELKGKLPEPGQIKRLLEAVELPDETVSPSDRERV